MATPTNEPAPFNAAEPLAFFLTWTTYGSWLPGDERGWHDRGGPGIRPPNTFLAESAGSRMREGALILSPVARRVVEATIRDHCEIRGWSLRAANVRSNHVHVVVTAPGYAPETVRDQFKAWCSRRLNESGVRRKRFWTEGGSCRSINREDDLDAVIVYVREAQDRKGAEGGEMRRD